MEEWIMPTVPSPVERAKSAAAAYKAAIDAAKAAGAEVKASREPAKPPPP